MKNILFALICILVSSWVTAQTPNAWSSQDYDFYAGDFSGDGLTDILFISHSPNMPSGILLSDGTAPTILGQTWGSNYLGSPWSSDAYLVHAVDFDGDGKADIWRSTPDVLASIANYMQKSGWRPELPWGFEVAVPAQFDYRLSRGTLAEWSQRGLRRADGRPLPAAGHAILFFPSGAAGPAFLVTENFIVLKRYNNSDAYALAVGILADRVHGLPGVRAAWPADDVQPSRHERIALQHRLAALGYKVADQEGHLDFEMRDAIRELQARFGMVPDGHPSRAFLGKAGVTDVN